MKAFKWIVLLLILAVAGAILYLATSNTSTEVTVEDSASSSTAADSDIEPGLRPSPGTYAASGSGGEAVTALSGGEHTFPEEVPAEVTLDEDDDCQFSQRFRWVEESELTRFICVDETGVVEQGYSTAVEFFGATTKREYECPSDAYWFTFDQEVGSTQEKVCTSEGSELAVIATYVGEETLSVGGEETTVYHVETDSTFTGAVNGSSKAGFWLADSGLIVKVTTDSKTTTKAVFGDTDYTPKYEYVLTTLDPQ